MLKKTKRAFTLLEIAVVLAAISALIVVIAIGQQLRENAEITGIISYVDTMDKNVRTFASSYNFPLKPADATTGNSCYLAAGAIFTNAVFGSGICGCSAGQGSACTASVAYTSSVINTGVGDLNSPVLKTATQSQYAAIFLSLAGLASPQVTLTALPAATIAPLTTPNDFRSMSFLVKGRGMILTGAEGSVLSTACGGSGGSTACYAPGFMYMPYGANMTTAQSWDGKLVYLLSDKDAPYAPAFTVKQAHKLADKISGTKVTKANSSKFAAFGGWDSSQYASVSAGTAWNTVDPNACLVSSPKPNTATDIYFNDSVSTPTKRICRVAIVSDVDLYTEASAGV